MIDPPRQPANFPGYRGLHVAGARAGRGRARCFQRAAAAFPDHRGLSVKVPMLDLVAQHQRIKDEVLPAVMSGRRAAGVHHGPGSRPARGRGGRASPAPGTRIACASGTDALLLPLRALDLKPGDEVITPPFTFFATAGAIHNAGGRPVFVDIDPGTLQRRSGGGRGGDHAADPGHRRRCTSSGRWPTMERFVPIAEAARPDAVIEDAAQSIGARRKVDGDLADGRRTRHGAARFSFFPTKNLGALGRRRHDRHAGRRAGGTAAARAAARRGSCSTSTTRSGSTAGSTTLQAAVLLAKLPYLAAWSEAGVATSPCATTQAFAGVPGVTPPPTDPANEHIFHQYTIRADRRDALLGAPQGPRDRVRDLLPARAAPAALLCLSGVRRASLPLTEAAPPPK